MLEQVIGSSAVSVEQNVEWHEKQVGDKAAFVATFPSLEKRFRHLHGPAPVQVEDHVSQIEVRSRRMYSRLNL